MPPFHFKRNGAPILTPPTGASRKPLPDLGNGVACEKRCPYQKYPLSRTRLNSSVRFLPPRLAAPPCSLSTSGHERSRLEWTVRTNKAASREVRIKNTSESKVAFKVKTTAPRHYCVRPNVGILAAYDTVAIEGSSSP